MSHEVTSPLILSAVVVVDLEPVGVDGLDDFDDSILDDSNIVAHCQNKDICQVCASSKFELFQFSGCGHRFCTECVKRVFKMNVMESQVDIQCLRCNKSISQEEIRCILDVDDYDKYLGFTLRHYLSRMSGVINCPAPDCPFACINTITSSPPSSSLDSDQNSEPNHFICLREGCGYEQCIACKRVWHQGKTCKEYARDHPPTPEDVDLGTTGGQYISGKTKACPSCRIPIEKMEDGSCNQVTCMVCRTHFCWLCGQQVSQMHFISPSGCPLFGSEVWSTRKRYFWKVWLLLAAPFLIILLALIAVPLVLITFPLLLGIQVYKLHPTMHKCVRATLIGFTVVCAILVAPLVAVIAGLLVFPFGCAYFFICVPAT